VKPIGPIAPPIPTTRLQRLSAKAWRKVTRLRRALRPRRPLDRGDDLAKPKKFSEDRMTASQKARPKVRTFDLISGPEDPRYFDPRYFSESKKGQHWTDARREQLAAKRALPCVPTSDCLETSRARPIHCPSIWPPWIPSNSRHDSTVSEAFAIPRHLALNQA
jgi:hypothetical protein